jgi:hypothetical protein
LHLTFDLCLLTFDYFRRVGVLPAGLGAAKRPVADEVLAVAAAGAADADAPLVSSETLPTAAPALNIATCTRCADDAWLALV